MFNEVKIVAYGEIFGAIPVEDRSDLPRSRINKVIERRHIHVSQNNGEFCKMSVLLSNFRDTCCDPALQVFVPKIKTINTQLYARKRSINEWSVGNCALCVKALARSPTVLNR